MKKVLFLSFLFVSFLNFTYAQVEFEEPSTVEEYNELMQFSRQENVPVFIDCYASWCNPCKMMDTYTFGNQEVANYMNERFLCISIDMESSLGEAIKQAFRVDSYPTFLFLNNRQKLVAKRVGYMGSYTFLSTVKSIYTRL